MYTVDRKSSVEFLGVIGSNFDIYLYVVARNTVLYYSLRYSELPTFNVPVSRKCNVVLTIMRANTYGKKTPLKGFHKDVLQSAPEETTRLLQDSIRIADETESIGTATTSYRKIIL